MTTSATTTTTTTQEPSAHDLDYNNPQDYRLNRYNMNKYIERSQFGLRNKDLNNNNNNNNNLNLNQLNRDLNQYYSIDQIHD